MLITDGPRGIFFEVDSNGKKLWKYVNPVNASGVLEQGTILPIQNDVFRSTFYPSGFEGFKGKKLISDLPIELKPDVYTCHLDSPPVSTFQVNQVVPVIYQDADQIQIILPVNDFDIRLLNMFGQLIYSGHNENHISTSELVNGFYLILIKTPDGRILDKKVVIAN